jgi:hypothetical protein
MGVPILSVIIPVTVVSGARWRYPGRPVLAEASGIKFKNSNNRVNNWSLFMFGYIAPPLIRITIYSPFR